MLLAFAKRSAFSFSAYIVDGRLRNSLQSSITKILPLSKIYNIEEVAVPVFVYAAHTPTRQTSEYGTQVVMTWRMWANISHVGGMWVLDGFLLFIWEE